MKQIYPLTESGKCLIMNKNLSYPISPKFYAPSRTRIGLKLLPNGL